MKLQSKKHPHTSLYVDNTYICNNGTLNTQSLRYQVQAFAKDISIKIWQPNIIPSLSGASPYQDTIMHHPLVGDSSTGPKEDDILTPTSLLGEVDSGRGSCPTKKPGFSGPARKLLSVPPELKKNHCPCIFEGCFSINLILSAFSSPRSNI